MQQVIEYQDVDPNAPFYVRNASVQAIAPYVLGQIVAPVAPPPAPAKQGLVYSGNGALPNNYVYDDAA
jgi:hypothetical protein